MRLKSVIAPTMAEAMRQVRSLCGEDAVIISTRETANEVLLMVAVPREAAAPPVPTPAPPPADAGDPVDTIADSLAWHGVPNTLTNRIVAAAEQTDLPDPQRMLTHALGRVMRFGRLPAGKTAPPLLVVGPPGAGKSVSIAKLAIRAVQDGLLPAVVTMDAGRAGALAQLGTFCKAVGVDLQQADDEPALRDSMLAAAGHTPILIDTPGCDPYAPAEVATLARRAAMTGALPVLTLPCGIDPAEAGDVAAIFREVGAVHLIATRLDVARRLGGLLAAAATGNLALVECGASRRVADALTPLDPATLARRLLAGGRPTHATASERAIA